MSIDSVSQTIRAALSDGVVTAEELAQIAEEARRDGLTEDEKLLVQDFILQHYHSTSFEGARTTADSLFDEFYTPAPDPSGARAIQVCIDGQVYQGFRTAGGYTIVIEGNGAISIYGPGQTVDGSTPPLTRIWGDPHVNEGDGTNWDFTRDGDLVLPDGTVIALNTTSETGASVLESLTIYAGNERIEVRDLQARNPTWEIAWDGEAALRQYLAAHPNRERYHLFGTEPGSVEWYLERNGRMIGRISGSRSVDGTFEVDTDSLGSGSCGMTLARALALLRSNFSILDAADGLADGQITLLGLAKILNDPNVSPELKAAARYLLEHRDELAQLTGSDLRLSESELICADDEISTEAEIDFVREEMNNILSDPTLTVEDKITFLLYLLMKTLDTQIERQGRYIMDLQLNGVESEAKRRVRGGQTEEAPRPNGWGEAAQGTTTKDQDDRVRQQSVDTETLNLKRLVDKRSQIFDTLRQIIDRYNQTAKSLIDSMGR